MMATSKRIGRPGFPKGFTLIEVLVVIVIISIVLGFAVLDFDTDPEELDNEAHRIAALMELASEEAVMNSRDYLMLLGENDYSFRVLTSGEWQVPADDMFRLRRLPEGYALSALIDSRKFTFSNGTKNSTGKKAAIFFLSSNETSPFEIKLTGPSGLTRTISNGDGKISTFPQ